MMECFGSSLMAREDALLLLLLTSILGSALGNTRYFTRMRTNASDLFKTKGENPRDEDERMIKDVASPQYDRRNSFVEASTFNPDVLNRFLEEYASKIKGTTDKNLGYPFKILKPAIEPLALEIDDETTQSPTAGYEQDSSVDETSNSTVNEEGLPDNLNDSIKRNKYYGANSHDDRNGWVTLEAIPWSKSKISKWQANPSTQRPWPEIKPWEKPTLVKPWTSDYSVRPIYDNNKPWYDKPKPTWPENANEKPWQKPTSRPSYYQDKYEESSNQNQKWPSERPSWNKYPGLSRPNSDIITDDRPTNFPNTWNKPQATKPSHQFADRYADKSQTEGSNENWQDFPSRYEQPNDRLRLTTERPSFSQYQYTNDHPPNHPANGDGQWVLLSTNRGYSKSKQRSIKIDAINPEAGRATNVTRPKRIREQEPTVAVMTSKRQVRLTVLPSINGTNTTTSHGGLLEVEKTFKSVEQSHKEYELEKLTTEPTYLKRRPIRNTLIGQPSNSAVLAAIGAGMLPATMAMMIPMILGRRRRDVSTTRGSLREFAKVNQADLRGAADKYDARRSGFSRS
ncbi:hypothetical protein KM043_014036 [Ampulex compressa]|nr:hypothetical protein KM043_014036 [Ampulex compressa]